MKSQFKKGDLVFLPRLSPKVTRYAVVLRVTENYFAGPEPQTGRWDWAIVCLPNGTKGKVHLSDLEKVNESTT